MTARQKVLGGAGVVFLAAAGVWFFVLAPRWTQRLPPGWSTRMQYVGYIGNPDPKTGGFATKLDDSSYERFALLVDESDRPRSVILEERYVIRDLDSDSITFEYVTRYRVDPATGAHVDEAYKGEYAVMPAHLRQTTYRLRSSYLEGVPVAFSAVEDIRGLRTFRFEYRGPVEYTKSYKGTDVYEGVKVEPGQQIRCVDDQFYFRIWAEPRTGTLVKIEEGCPSGDYIVDASGRKVAPVLTWAGVTLGDDLAERVALAERRRLRALIMSIWIPAGLLAVGTLLLAAAVRGRLAESPS